MKEEQIWEVLEKTLMKSNCLKTKTSAALVKDGEIISLATNSCAPEGYNYDEKIYNCPRMNIKTGTHYELCRPIHAERRALLNIRPNRSLEEIGKFASHLEVSREEILAAFTQYEREKIRGSMLYLLGHYWACEGCVMFLEVLGIPESNIIFNRISAKETKSKYEKNGLV